MRYKDRTEQQKVNPYDMPPTKADTIYIEEIDNITEEIELTLEQLQEAIRFGQNTEARMYDDDDILLLQDPQFLMVLVAAITKKLGGSVEVTMEDLENISADEALGLFKDADENDKFVLKLVDRNEYESEIASASERKNKKTTKSSKDLAARYAVYDDEEWEN